jgi:cellulose synthase/poly-beta-1,6-N-acetylglucosamine synthase-like glycosyltransferase
MSVAAVSPTGTATLTIVMFLAFASYVFVLFVQSRRRRPEAMPAPEGLLFVFVVPCLNEEMVIAASLDRLLAFPQSNVAVICIDDGSEDRTAEIVAGYDPRRVWLLRRELPNARLGKGRALNAAYRHIRDSGLVDGYRPQDVILCVLDADGRLSSNAITEVAPFFRDPRVGAVQVGVRMYNAAERLIARMQDLEFVAFTEVFQRGRMKVGSVGLGGNGQFTRLSALEDLGDEPWTDCLTEDLDLGVRLLVAGWENRFCPTTEVSQQAVTDLRRLVRQRSRWFQGHLQCWKRIPLVLRSSLPAKTTGDLVYHLSSPAVVLLTSFPLVAFAMMLGASLTSPTHAWTTMTGGSVESMLLWYVLAFGLAPCYAFAYWLKTPEMGFVRALGLAHLYTLYSYLWFPAGWMAVSRILVGKRGWAKTSRTPDVVPDVVPGEIPAV